MDFLQKPGHEEEMRRYKEYGPIYGFFEGNKANLSIAEPAVLNSILFKNFHNFNGRRELFTGDVVVDNMMAVIRGDDWERIRRIVSPTFNTSTLKSMMSIFKDCSEIMIQNLRDFAEGGKFVDMKRIFGAFTMDVIAQSAFSTKIDSQNDPDNKFVLYAKRVLNTELNLKFICFHMLPTKIMQLLKITVTDVEATHALKESALEIMEKRKMSGEVKPDFLQFLMNAAKAEEDKGLGSSNSDENDSDHNKPDKKVSRRMSMDELASQSVAFFLAGYDTTATTLSCATHLLALNPNIQDKLRDEVDKVLDEHSGELTFEAIQSMKYMDNVLSETLRLFPPIYRLERQANNDCKLVNTGITVRKGMLVTIPIYAINRDPKYWEDPETFNPDRFENRCKKQLPHFLPFGGGKKQCVGMRFADSEIKVCLSYMLANFQIHTCRETKVPIEFDKGLNGLLQPYDITLRMEIRKNPPLIKMNTSLLNLD